MRWGEIYNGLVMLDEMQQYVANIAECLLIELALDQFINQEELNKKTLEIFQLISSQEGKNYLVEKIENRDEMYTENPNFKIILDMIR